MLNQTMSQVMRLAQSNPEGAVEKLDEVLKTIKSKETKLQLTVMKAQLLAQSDKTKEALAVIDGLIADPANKGFKDQLQMMRVQMVIMTGTPKQISQTANELYKNADADPQMINFVAWSIVEQTEEGKIEDKALIKSSLAAVQVAVKKMEGDVKAAGLDTLAHLQFLDGDKAGALKTQEEAIAATSNAQLKAQLTEYLKKIKAEK
jgi:ferritin